MALPLQILPAEETFGGKLGTGLGTGIGAGLQNLAQIKLNELAQRNQQAQASKFWQELGLPSSIGALPPQVQKGLLDRLEGVTLGGQQTGMQNLQQMGQPMAQESQQSPQQQGGAVIGLSPAERRFRQDQALKQKKLDLGIRKEAREYLAPFEQKYEQGQETLRSNNQLIQLARSGKLRAGVKQKLLDKLDLGEFWQPIENELAKKNLARQATRAGSAFNTSRLTNLDVNLYKNSLGTLWNTSKGIEAIARINNFELKAQEAKQKARREIIKQNNGEIPFDIESQIEERAQPLLKKYANKSMRIVTNAINETPGKNVAARKNSFADLNAVPTQGIPVGKKIINDETGETLIWDGKGWGSR